MLVLTRCRGEKVVAKVGDTTITVVVVDAGNGKVRLGFDAPAEVGIWRSELLDEYDDRDYPGTPARSRPRTA